jgi:hypothetical protein
MLRIRHIVKKRYRYLDFLSFLAPCKALRTCTVILMQKYKGMFFSVYQMHFTFFIILVIDRICTKKEFFCVSVVLFTEIRKTCGPFHFLQCKIQANFSPLSCQNKLEMEKFRTCCSLHEKGNKKGILVPTDGECSIERNLKVWLRKKGKILKG